MFFKSQLKILVAIKQNYAEVCKCFLKIGIGAGQTTHWLGAPTVLLEDIDSIPSTQMVAPNTL